MRTARESGAEITPIDSEHSALFQCIRGYSTADIAKIYITASGGPFRTWTPEQIAAAKPADALKHPTWRMGGKITIDSATLMNKGLEIIEACYLFNVPLEAVEVVVHPQSVVHSFVEMRDGALLAQLGLPDMRLPIQIALMHPDKLDTGLPRLRPSEIAALTFEEPDHERFPAIGLARRAAQIGSTMPAVLNAANEAAVEAFLTERIGFTEICRLVEGAMEAHRPRPADTLEMIRAADAEARRYVAMAVGE
jgi:1-deoxy-D-xylulose-5-phosphate reductoisomerase